MLLHCRDRQTNRFQILQAPIIRVDFSLTGSIMKKKLSFIVLGGSGSKIRQIHLTTTRVVVLGLTFVVAVTALIYGAVDYVTMRSEMADKKVIERRLAVQNDEVRHQRRQIEKFAKDINALKERIMMLDKFEKKIRLLANIEHPGKTDGLFGVGGSAPEDLNPEVEVDRAPSRLVRDMHRQVKQLSEASHGQEITLTTLLGHLEEQKNVLAHTPAIRPVKGWITSSFDYRISPFTGRKEFHKGIDIANRKGTEIVATADGVVSFVGEKGSLGNVLIIDHGYGIVTRFAHIEKGLKKRGERVHRGDVIALMGNTGRSTGPHLHYEVRLNGLPVDPMKYILN